MQRQKLIINADDFGETLEKNQAIKKCMQEGWISNCTLLTNTDYFLNACEIYENEPIMKNKVGIHLNISSGVPLTDAIKKQKIFCNPNGEFNFKRYRHLMLSSEESKALYGELNAQFKKMIDARIEISHIDTHHHTHWEYPIYAVIKVIAKEYEVKKIRLARNLCISENIFKKIYKTFLNNDIKKHFICTDFFGDANDLESYPENSLKTTEINMHPSFQDDELIDQTDTIRKVNENYIDYQRYTLASYCDL